MGALLSEDKVDKDVVDTSISIFSVHSNSKQYKIHLTTNKLIPIEGSFYYLITIHLFQSDTPQDLANALLLHSLNFLLTFR